jgi:5-methyltetrahydropteroyltriglutamate--homocysteine methyltransferase
MMPTLPPLLPTTVVGSYPQPDWLINRELLAKGVPRVGLPDLWRVPPAFLEQAQDDATALAIRDMERAGIDIITDGEVRRESYSNHFVSALEGLDTEQPATITNRRGRQIIVPRVVGRVRRTHAVEVGALAFLRRSTELAIKVTLPGPFTMSQQAADEFYLDPEALAMDFAIALNEEVLALQAAGADVIQLDEPWLRNDPSAAERYAVNTINRALAGVTATTIVHLCFGYAAVALGQKPTGYSFLPQLAATVADQISIEAAQPKLDLGVLSDLSDKGIVLGVLDLADPAVETVGEVTQRIREGLRYVAAERLVPAPDCGMKYLPREIAFGKLQVLGKAARAVRAEIG